MSRNFEEKLDIIITIAPIVQRKIALGGKEGTD